MPGVCQPPCPPLLLPLVSLSLVPINAARSSLRSPPHCRSYPPRRPAGRSTRERGRDGGEREAGICRYLLRHPFAEERLSQLPDGRIAYGLRKPRWDGGMGIVLEPVEFLAKLAALVPPPRAHLVRYHGVLGPHGSVRRQVVPARQEGDSCAKVRGCGAPPRADRVHGEEAAGQARSARRDRTPRIDWPTLMRRTLGLDVLACPRCDGRMRVIACITEPGPIRKILRAMKLSTEIPRPLPARAPPQGEFEFGQEERGIA